MFDAALVSTGLNSATLEYRSMSHSLSTAFQMTNYRPTPMSVMILSDPGASAEGADPAPSSLIVPTANWPLAGPWRGGRQGLCLRWVGGCVVGPLRLGAILCSRDARSLRCSAGVRDLEAEVGRRDLEAPGPFLWGLVCWAHQPLFPSAVTANARSPPSSTYLSVFGSGLSCRYWKKSLLRGSLV